MGRSIGVSEFSDSSSSSIMPPRAERPVVSEALTRILSPGESLGREDGSWAERDYYFVQCPSEPKPLEYYYRDLSEAYGGPDGTEGREPNNQERLDGLFAGVREQDILVPLCIQI